MTEAEGAAAAGAAASGAAAVEAGALASASRIVALTFRERGADSEYRELDRRALRYAVRRAYHGFFLHRGIDSAAALTFFSALSIFPAVLAVVSVVGLLDPEGDAVRVILNIIDAFVPQSTVNTTRLALEQFTQMPDPGVTLAAGIGLLLLSGSSYATAFGRAVNTIYEVQEGRRFLKLRALMLVEALALIVLLSVIAVIVIVTPDVAETVVTTLGWPDLAAVAWAWLKWPLLAVLAVFTVVVLYYGTPNLRRPRIRWLSVGASFSILAWAVTTAGYSIYVATFSSYDEFYGLLGGAIVTLIWLYLSNLVLVIGVEFDAELTRARELLRGIAAEESIQVPIRDNYRNFVLARRLASDTRDGRELREHARLLTERRRRGE